MTGRPIVFHCTAGAGGIAAADRATKPWIVQLIVRFRATMTERRPVRIRRTNSKPPQNKTAGHHSGRFIFARLELARCYNHAER
jgi:hypothetical protein